jgi:hypothetical protein
MDIKLSVFFSSTYFNNPYPHVSIFSYILGGVKSVQIAMLLSDTFCKLLVVVDWQDCQCLQNFQLVEAGITLN